MVDVSVRVISKGFQVGPVSAFPAIIDTAVASPKARPSPSVNPVTMEDRAAGTITLNEVWVGVAPSAREAESSCLGTDRMPDTANVVIVG